MAITGAPLQTPLLDTFRFFGNRFTPIAFLILPPVLINELLSHQVYLFLDAREMNDLAGFVAFGLDLLVGAFYEAAIVCFIASVVTGKPLSVLECWRFGVANWPAFILLYLALSLAVGFGLAFFIVPGLFVLSRFAFAEFGLLLEGRVTIDALRASWQATEPHMWILLRGYFLLLLIVFVPHFTISAVWEIESATLNTALSASQSLLGVLLTIFAFRVYHAVVPQSRGTAA